MQSESFDRELMIHRVGKVIELIDEVVEDLSTVDYGRFRKSSLLVRATSFSLAQIGECMNTLHKKIGEKYSNIPWKDAIKMRNFLVHDYEHVNEEIVYTTAIKDLPELKEQLVGVIEDFEKGTEIPC